MLQELSINKKSFDDLIKSNLTEDKLNQLAPDSRLAVCVEKIMNGKNSESQRWDCLIIICEFYVKIKGKKYPKLSPKKIKEMISKIESTLKWMIYNEENCVVHHEIAYQVAARNMVNLIPDMVYAALNSDSIVSRHEYLECLGVMKAFDEVEKVIPFALQDENPDVRQTAEFAKDRLKRYVNEKDWSALEIV